MPENDRVYKGKIKQSGIFNFKDFYEFLYDTFMDENYDVFESKYSEKLKGDSKDVTINWEATKEISSYFHFVIKIEWIILGMKKVKVKKDGQDITMDSGAMEVSFTADLVKDPGDSWKKIKYLRYIYDNFIARDRINDYEVKLFEEVNEFIAHGKSFLAIEGQHDY